MGYNKEDSEEYQDNRDQDRLKNKSLKHEMDNGQEYGGYGGIRCPEGHPLKLLSDLTSH